MTARSRARTVPAAVRSQLRVVQKQAEAAKPVIVPEYSPRERDIKAELDWIRNGAERDRLRLSTDVEAVTLRTTAANRPAGVRAFLRDVWPRLAYHNDHVRTSTVLHYTKRARLRENAALEAKAAQCDATVARLQRERDRLEDIRLKQRSLQAKEMGVTELELESAESAEPPQESVDSERLRLQIADLQSTAAGYRSHIAPVERLDGRDRIVDDDAARAAARAQAAKRNAAAKGAAGAEDEGGDDDGDDGDGDDNTIQVVGPTTPLSVVRAVRNGQNVDLPVRHCLEVSYRSGGMGTVSFDFPADEADPAALLDQVGLAAVTPRPDPLPHPSLTGPPSGLAPTRAHSEA